MIARVRSWYSERKKGTKILLAAAGAVVALALLYVAARSVQYVGASRRAAGEFVPDGAEIVVRVSDLAGRWAAVRETELWKRFTGRLQKDPAIRRSLNEILDAAGAPTLDQLEDRRWLDRNPLMTEASILRYAGRDFVLSSTGGKFCVATRVGLGDFLLLPGLRMFPGAAGATRTGAEGVSFLRRGDLFIAVQGAIVVASNDSTMLLSALRRRGAPESPPGLVRASFQAKPLIPVLKGFPLGALLAVADVETCRRIDLDVLIEGADLVVRATADGLQPRRAEPAPVDIVQMVPANGLGSCVTNVESAVFWDWIRQVGDRRVRSGSALDRSVRDAAGEFIEILHSQGFGEGVVPKLDGPVSILFGASEGDDGRTYAAVALYLRSSQPREAAEALQGFIDRATEEFRDKFRPTDGESGGVPHRSYRFEPDPFQLNNFMAVCYAVTGDALILANNRLFLSDALRCRANETPPMAVQIHYQQAMRRLQELGMRRVMAPGAAASLFLYGPAIRQGLEGFYATLASRIVDTPRNRTLLRQELQTQAAREGQPMTPRQLDDQWDLVIQERTRAKEDSLRGRARILDFLQWIAFQAETIPGGMKLEFALELK